jgi:hypothetical protein
VSCVTGLFGRGRVGDIVTWVTGVLGRGWVVDTPMSYSGRHWSGHKARGWFPVLQLKDIRGGADTSLDRTSSRCRRTESIVPLERGICSCAEFGSLFLLQRLKESMSGDVRDFHNIETLVCNEFFFCKCRRRRKLTPNWQKY